MTFDQLRVDFRRDVLADPTTDVFADADLNSMLFNAAAEIAAMLRFPQATATGATAVDDTSISAPADMAGVAPERLVVNGFDLQPADMASVLKARIYTDGFPSVFNWEPRRAGSIEFGCAVTAVGTYTLVYTQKQDPTSMSAGDQVWGGAASLQGFSYLVPLRAGNAVFRALEQYERAQQYDALFMSGLQAFAASLGLTDIGNLMVPIEARNDRGSEVS